MTNVVARLSNGHSAAKSLKGIYSICSAHPWVLGAAMQQALDDDTPLLVESTSNQVDQYGGYTGMKPADFVRFAHLIAERVGLPREHLILGGDHLGPNAWRSLPAEEAMQRAEALIDAYVCGRIHEDPSGHQHGLRWRSGASVGQRRGATCGALVRRR